MINFLPIFTIILGGLLISVIYTLVINWYKDLVFILASEDKDFPGKNDKTTWVVIFFFIPLLAPFIFKSHMRLHKQKKEKLG